MMEHMDGLRKLLLLEPRGYPCQNANFIVPSSSPDAAFGFVIAEQNFIYPMMSGHNAICVATALLEAGMVPMEEPTTRFSLEAPAGLIEVEAECSHGRATAVTLRNQPAFCRERDMDVEVQVPHVGSVNVTVAYGGMFYALVDAESVGLELIPERGREIVRLGEMIKVATREQHPVAHPEFHYPGPDILCFRGPVRRSGREGLLTARNAVVMSNGELDWDRPETWTAMIDRSPCGTGTCAVMAAMHAKGELAIGEDFVHESIIGTSFIGRLHGVEMVGEASGEPIAAVQPSIRGRGWVTQHATVVCDPTDPFPEGYTVGDIWC
jgi:proline racemase